MNSSFLSNSTSAKVGSEMQASPREVNNNGAGDRPNF